MAFTIYHGHSIPHIYSVLLEKTWKRTILANAKGGSLISIPNGKSGLPLEVVHNFRKDFPEKKPFHLTSNRNFGFFGYMVSTLYFPLQSNRADGFLGQNAEVRDAKELTSDICRKVLITKSYQGKPVF